MGDPFTVYDEDAQSPRALRHWLTAGVVFLLLLGAFHVWVTPRPAITSYPVMTTAPGTVYIQTSSGQVTVDIPRQLHGTPVRVLVRQQAKSTKGAIPSWTYVVVTDTGNRYTITR